MQFGLFNLMTTMTRSNGISDVVRETLKSVRAAEAAGFDVAWFAEHLDDYCG